jgi:hypothetical protein
MWIDKLLDDTSSARHALNVLVHRDRTPCTYLPISRTPEILGSPRTRAPKHRPAAPPARPSCAEGCHAPGGKGRAVASWWRDTAECWRGWEGLADRPVG